MNQTPTTLSPEATDAIKAAIASGSYLMAIYAIENGQVTLRRITREFPRADFETAIQLLTTDLNAELQREQGPEAAPAPTGPLPLGAPPEVAIDLFGQGPPSPPPTPEG